MQARHNPQLNMSLSPLGFGVMRLPMNSDGTFAAETHRLLAEAHACRINYFDTAYPYLDGHSEELIRDALVAKFSRDSFYIADKLPVWDCADRGDMERVFTVQLERLGVEYIDFYLLHGLHRARWLDIYGKGVLGFLEQKREEGKIRKIGFSFHDAADALTPILETYNWDFAQLQINYYDWTMQNARDSYNILAERGIPCMVMEPVGGGRLAKLPKEASDLLEKERPGHSAASWAIRFAAGLSNVAVVLSGMSDFEQLADNLAVFDSVVPLSGSETAALRNVVKILSQYKTVPCTACGYCVEDCRQNVDIPQIFKRYNDYRQFDNMTRFDIDYFTFVPEVRRAGNCISCGACAEKCPQKIDIPRELEMIHSTAVGLSLGVDIDKLRDSMLGGLPLVCFGAGARGRGALAALRECGLKVRYFCDNSERLWGTTVDGVEIISPERLQEIGESENPRVLITSGYYSEIKEQLNAMNAAVLNEAAI